MKVLIGHLNGGWSRWGLVTISDDQLTWSPRTATNKMYHIEVWLKWPPFCRRHFQIHCCILSKISVKCAPKGPVSIDGESVDQPSLYLNQWWPSMKRRYGRIWYNVLTHIHFFYNSPKSAWNIALHVVIVSMNRIHIPVSGYNSEWHPTSGISFWQQTLYFGKQDRPRRDFDPMIWTEANCLINETAPWQWVATSIHVSSVIRCHTYIWRLVYPNQIYG